MAREPETPEQLRAMLDRRGRLQVQIQTLRKRLDDERHNLRLCAPDAETEIAKIEAAIAPLQAELDKLGESIAVQQAEHRIRMEEFAAAKPYDDAVEISALATERLKLAHRADKLAVEIGEVLDLMLRAGRELARRTGKQEAERLMSRAAFDLRTRRAFARKLEMKGEASGPTGLAPRWLPFDLPFVGEAAFSESLEALERDTQDAFVETYTSREDAEAARKRIDPGGKNLHVVPEGEFGRQFFRLVHGQLRGRDK